MTVILHGVATLNEGDALEIKKNTSSHNVISTHESCLLHLRNIRFKKCHLSDSICLDLPIFKLNLSTGVDDAGIYKYFRARFTSDRYFLAWKLGCPEAKWIWRFEIVVYFILQTASGHIMNWCINQTTGDATTFLSVEAVNLDQLPCMQFLGYWLPSMPDFQYTSNISNIKT